MLKYIILATTKQQRIVLFYENIVWDSGQNESKLEVYC